jgi:hypothetical protein
MHVSKRSAHDSRKTGSPSEGRRGRKRRARAASAGRAFLEFLEARQLLSVAVTGTVTLDESPGLQNSGIAVTGEDNNDNDVAVGNLPAAFANRLFTAPTAGLGLSNAFSTANGVGKSADNFITVTVTGTSTIVSLGFVQNDANNTPLPVLGSGTGVASGLSAVNGGAISLFADPVLGNRMVIGVDTNGDKVLAMFLDPNATLTSAKIWTVQFEALANPDATNPDDPVTLGGLKVASGTSTEFNFNALPSGQNLFGTVGSTSTALVVIGAHPVLNPDGTFTNASNTINTSQGGGPTTIGVNNQMFDQDEGAYFTFVKNPDPNYLAGAPNGLDQNEADDADNIVYTGGTIEANGGFVRISQIQGNSPATMKITAYNMADSPQGQTFVNTGLGTGTQVTITAIKVFDASGNQVANPQVTITNGVATVAGLGAGYRIAWTTSAPADQILIQDVAGKFDIGGFGVDEPSSAVTPLTGVRFEDDGPSITATIQNAPTLTVDETTLTTDATGSFAAQFTPIYGTDGQGTAAVSYALSTPGGASGLTETATGQAVNLSLNASGQVEGRTATSNDLVFVVSVNSSGVVTLDQRRAVVHADTTNPDDSRTLTSAGLVVLTATAKDGDNDTASAPLNIGQRLVFKDDGPSITATIVGAPTLTVDETNLATNATGSFAAQFTPVFGADGQGATPVSYALSTAGGASGLTDTATGQAVNLSLNASGQVEGRTAVSNVIVFVVSVNSSGVITLDQQRAIRHADTTNPDDSRTLTSAGLVVLTATATDGDGDTANTPLNIGQQLVFKDDGPAIGPIGSSIVDFASGSTVTKTLNGAVGADPNSTPYTVDSFTSTLTVNGVTLKGVLSANMQVVTYWADTNNNTTFGDTGDTAYYRLTLGEAGAGTYTFDVLVNPPPATLSFNFNALPSGQNLFGTVGDTSNALVVIGAHPVLNADGTFTNASNTINTSQGGGPTTIGVNNQMFDAGEGAYFTFVKSPVANYLAGAPGGLDQNEADDADNIQYTGGTLEVNSAFLKISQIQGNSTATMDITAYNMGDSPQGQNFVNTGLGSGPKVAITAVRVFDAAGNQVANPSVTITNGVARVAGLGAGYRVEWDASAPFDQVLVTAVAGKFDIGGFGTTQAQPTPDQKLDFVVRVTDGDGDFSTAGFSIGIDGTGTFHDGIVSGVTPSLLIASQPVVSSESSLAALQPESWTPSLNLLA